jgi:hypothetical protein
MLEFNEAWRFDSPGSIPSGVVEGFSNLIGKIASQGDRHQLLEHFKSYFAAAAGFASNWSSSASWAETDLDRYMHHTAENAPLFIEAFYDACESLRPSGIALPNLNRVNRILLENDARYEISPPDLLVRNPQVQITLPERSRSLDEQAVELIQHSLKESESLLSEGRWRQAVQEVLWLLETVSTAFQGLDSGTGTIQGKYFNKIAADLRSHNRGKTLDQVLGWITALHGYLSSPTGGGVRHGTDLKAGIAIEPGEARLFCNLIRSYIDFLLTEHERLIK